MRFISSIRSVQLQTVHILKNVFILMSSVQSHYTTFSQIYEYIVMSSACLLSRATATSECSIIYVIYF
jgi:hypothetical protein